MKTVRWILGGAAVALVAGAILLDPPAFLAVAGQAHIAFVARAFYILLLCAVLCLFRVLAGPTSADRIMAIDIVGILIVGICALLSVSSGQSWYIDIGIAWALQSFIGVLALAKYLEGKAFDE